MGSAAIGQMLREAREDAGLTTQALSRRTRIPESSVLALEAGRFESLPAPVFVRGFMRAMSREIALDPTEVLRCYEAYLHESEIASVHEEQAPLGPLLLVGSSAGPTQASHRGLQISHMLLLLLALATFIIAYVTAGMPSHDPTGAGGIDRAATTAPGPPSAQASDTSP